MDKFYVKHENIVDNGGAIIVKLVEKLHNMRSVDAMDGEKKSVKAKETLELFYAERKKNRE